MLYLGTAQLSWSNEVLNQVIPGWDNERPQRPDFLNLNAERKPHFQFVAAPYTVHEETGTMRMLACHTFCYVISVCNCACK